MRQRGHSDTHTNVVGPTQYESGNANDLFRALSLQTIRFSMKKMQFAGSSFVYLLCSLLRPRANEQNSNDN